MDDDLTCKIVNALKQYAAQPQECSSGVYIHNLNIKVIGGIHISPPSESNPSDSNDPGKAPSSRRELIAAIQNNAGKYFFKNDFSSLLQDLFDSSNLSNMPIERLKQIWAWSRNWNREVVSMADG